MKVRVFPTGVHPFHLSPILQLPFWTYIMQFSKFMKYNLNANSYMFVSHCEVIQNPGLFESTRTLTSGSWIQLKHIPQESCSRDLNTSTEGEYKSIEIIYLR